MKRIITESISFQNILHVKTKTHKYCRGNCQHMCEISIDKWSNLVVVLGGKHFFYCCDPEINNHESTPTRPIQAYEHLYKLIKFY